MTGGELIRADSKRDYSFDVAKGILILLVIIGHNIVLVPYLGVTRKVIYHFHVSGFLFLAFWLTTSTPTLRGLVDRAVRYLYPYVLFVLISSIAYSLVLADRTQGPYLSRLARAIVWPTASSIDDASGLLLYWFLPCLFLLNVFRYALGFASGSWGMALALLAHLTIGLWPDEQLRSVPWMIPSTIHVLFLCMVVEFLRRWEIKINWPVSTVLFGISALAVVYFRTEFSLAMSRFYAIDAPLRLLSNDVLALSAFFWILHLSKRLTNVKPLVSIGRQSLGIYLIHSLIFHALYLGGKRIEMPVESFGWAVASFLLTLFFAWLISFTISNNKILRKLFFPRGASELLSWFGFKPSRSSILDSQENRRPVLALYISYDDTFTGGPRVVYNFVNKVDPNRFKTIVLTNKSSELTEALASAGKQYSIVPQNRWIGDDDTKVINGGVFKRAWALFQTLLYNRKIKRELNRYACDILWVRNIKGVLLSGIAAKRLGVPLVWDIGMEKKSRGIIRLLHNFGFRMSQKVVTEGSCVADGIFTQKQIDANSSKLTVIRSGIPVDRVEEIRRAVSNAQATQEPGDEFKIINIASICKRKNQSLLLEALLPLLADNPDLVIQLVGPVVEADYQLELESMAESVSKQVQFLGWRSDAVDLLAASDLFVLSSDNEGVPYSILESFHARIPVVATDCGGVPDVVSDGVTGMLISKGDATMMRDKIRACIDSKDLRKELANNAYRFVNENYSAELWITNYMELLDALLNEKKPKGHAG